MKKFIHGKSIHEETVEREIRLAITIAEAAAARWEVDTLHIRLSNRYEIEILKKGEERKRKKKLARLRVIGQYVYTNNKISWVSIMVMVGLRKTSWLSHRLLGKLVFLACLLHEPFTVYFPFSQTLHFFQRFSLSLAPIYFFIFLNCNQNSW